MPKTATKPTPAQPTTQPTSQPAAISEKKTAQLLDLTKLKRGDLLMLPYWGVVRSITTQGSDIKLELEPVTEGLSGNFFVHGNNLAQQGISSDIFADEVVECTQTELAEKFLEVSRHIPITVNFTKENGEERTLRGRIIMSGRALGDTLVEDLDIAVNGPSRLRTVVHRNLNWFVAEGVKYVLNTPRKKSKKS